MFLEDIVLRGYIRLLPLLLLISCGTKQVEYPDNVFFYSQFPQEKELKGEIIELDSIFFRYPFRVRVEGDKVIVMDLHGSWVFFLLVALFEEILMRGYILGRLLHTRMNKFLSLFISSALFALLHIFNPEIDFLPMLNLLLAGMLLGASYLYTKNLCFPISLHLFWNWIQGPVLGYEVSGNNFISSMLTLHLPEDNVLNGGAFGFEGSLICTVLMIVLTILIVWWGEKREAISLAVPQSC